MNVLLVNPPIGVAENRPPNNIPTGLAILTAMLRDCGHHVAVLDLNATRPDAATTEALIQDDPHEYDLIGLSGLITTLAWQERLARSLRARHPKALLVSGGGLATDIGPDLLSWIPALDGIVRGEGEQALATLLELAREREGIAARPGLSWRDGRFVLAAEAPQDLDLLPFPAWDALPIEIYLANPIWGGNSNNSSALGFTSQRSMNVLTSRGCPWTCKFCVSAMGFGRYRFRDAGNVVAEIETVIAEFGVDFIGFVDDNFMVHRPRLREVCAELKRIGIRWGCHGRLDQARPEVLELMADAGCVYIGYGGESASQPILDAMEKRITVEEMRDAVRSTKRVGITPNLTWISGYPGETRDDLRATARFILDEELANRRLFVATPYPGTPLFRDALPRIEAHFPSVRDYVAGLGDADRLLVNLSAMSDHEFRECRELIEAGELARI
ncbi:MAG: radical SAM protein [bacterium]